MVLFDEKVCQIKCIFMGYARAIYDIIMVMMLQQVILSSLGKDCLMLRLVPEQHS